jgi:hypothetical protein
MIFTIILEAGAEPSVGREEQLIPPPPPPQKTNLLVICFCKKNMLEFQNACDYMLCLKTIIKNMPSKLYFYYKKYEIIHDF